MSRPTTCIDCGNRLGDSWAEYEDGCICLDCDRKNDPDFADQPTIAPCVVCKVNFVAVGRGFDTCDDCLAKQ